MAKNISEFVVKMQELTNTTAAAVRRIKQIAEKTGKSEEEIQMRIRVDFKKRAEDLANEYMNEKF